MILTFFWLKIFYSGFDGIVKCWDIRYLLNSDQTQRTTTGTRNYPNSIVENYLRFYNTSCEEKDDEEGEEDESSTSYRNFNKYSTRFYSQWRFTIDHNCFEDPSSILINFSYFISFSL